MLLSLGVLVSLGCYSNRNLFLTVPETGKSEIKVLVLASWFIDSLLLTVFSDGGKGEGAFSSLFYRAQFPFMQALPSQSKHLPKPSTFDIITWGVGLQQMNLEGTQTFRP